MADPNVIQPNMGGVMSAAGTINQPDPFVLGFPLIARNVAVIDLDPTVEGLRALRGVFVVVESMAQNEDEWKTISNRKDFTHVFAGFLRRTTIGEAVSRVPSSRKRIETAREDRGHVLCCFHVIKEVQRSSELDSTMPRVIRDFLSDWFQGLAGGTPVRLEKGEGHGAESGEGDINDVVQRKIVGLRMVVHPVTQGISRGLGAAIAIFENVLPGHLSPIGRQGSKIDFGNNTQLGMILRPELIDAETTDAKMTADLQQRVDRAVITSTPLVKHEVLLPLSQAELPSVIDNADGKRVGGADENDFGKFFIVQGHVALGDPQSSFGGACLHLRCDGPQGQRRVPCCSFVGNLVFQLLAGHGEQILRLLISQSVFIHISERPFLSSRDRIYPDLRRIISR